MVTALVLCALRAMAADFSVVVGSGQTLYFNYVAGGVEVVYPANTQTPASGWNGFVRPSGALVIPSTVDHGGQSYAVVAVNNHAFYNCTGLTSLTIGEGVTILRSNAFGLCSGLTSIDLPSTLDTLGQSTFYNCTSLTTCTVRSAVPPRCHSAAFYNVPLASAILHVPCGCAAVYGAAAPWSSFGNVSEEGCSVTVSTGVNSPQRGSVSGGGEYAEGAQVTLTALPAEGCFFACWGDGDTLNPRVITAVAGARYVAHFFLHRHDTLRLVQHDTIHPQLCTLSLLSSDPWRGIVVGNATVPVGTQIEIVAIPMDGDAFLGWSDGLYENPRRVAVTGNMTLTASFGEYDGIDGVGNGEPVWTASTDGRMLTVHCGVGETVRLFDIQGRCMLTHTASAYITTLMLPAAGAYLVSVGTAPAKRIIVE